jgi:hypothetical protein
MNAVTVPGFTAEASLYQTNNHYRAVVGSFLSDGNTTVTPQDCGWVKGGLCGVVIVGGTAACTAVCLAPGGQTACYWCWAGFLGASFAFCKDCIPGWMRDLIHAFESGGGTTTGGGTTGGGGGGGGGQCGCPRNNKCCGACVKEPGKPLFCDGDCVPRNLQCP